MKEESLSDRGLEWWGSQGMAAAEHWNPLLQASEVALVIGQGVGACSRSYSSSTI